MVVFVGAEGKKFPTYRLSLNAIRTLWRETLLATAIIGASAVIKMGVNGSPFAPTLSQDVESGLFSTILLIPYNIAVYRFALGASHLSLEKLLREAIKRKHYLLYVIFFAIYDAFCKVALSTQYFNGDVVALVMVVPSVWITLRLFLVQPILATDGWGLTVSQAVRLTAGHVGKLLILVIRASVPLIGVMTATGFVLTVIYFVIIEIFPTFDSERISRYIYLLFIIIFEIYGKIFAIVLNSLTFKSFVTDENRRVLD